MCIISTWTLFAKALEGTLPCINSLRVEDKEWRVTQGPRSCFESKYPPNRYFKTFLKWTLSWTWAVFWRWVAAKWWLEFKTKWSRTTCPDSAKTLQTKVWRLLTSAKVLSSPNLRCMLFLSKRDLPLNYHGCVAFRASGPLNETCLTRNGYFSCRFRALPFKVASCCIMR